MPTKFYGTTYSTFHVNADGYVCFSTTPDNLSGPYGAYSAETDGRYKTHFQKRRLALFWRNLWSPYHTGDILVNRITTSGQERTVITYQALRNATATATDRVNAQVEFWDNGTITMTWLQCDNTGDSNDIMVGLSNVQQTGGTLPSGFLASDISAYGGSAGGAPSFATQAPTTATSGQVFTYVAAATDPDGSAMTLTAPTKPAWLTLTDHGDGTATLSGTPSAAGSHSITLRVSDGSSTADQTFTLVVQPSGGNTAPVISSTPTTLANSGTLYSYTATATDVDGQALTWSVITKPSWLTLTDNGNGTATLSGTAPDTAVSLHNVTLAVSDGITSTSQAFTVQVNRAPVITFDSPGASPVSIPPGVGLIVQTTVTDDSGTPTLAWSRVSGNGTATFESPAADDTAVRFSVAGTYVLRLTANDGNTSSTRDVTVVVSAPGASSAPTPTNAWWKLNENSGTTTADSVNANTGTLTNGPTWTAGKLGSALSFDGANDRVDVANHSSLQLTGNVTIALWVKRNQVSTGDSGDRLLSKKSAWNAAGGYEIELGNGSSELIVLAGGGNFAKATGIAWTTNWTHVAATINGTTCQVYINGVAATMSDSSVGALATDTNIFRLGCAAYGTPAGLLQGALDDVRLYNRVLTPTEINAVMNDFDNLGPIVDAGPDAPATVGDAVTLAGIVTDDGVPTTPGVSMTWTRVSGQGTFSLSSVSAPTTTVTFAAVGDHVMRLTATDGVVQTFDDVTLTATNPLTQGFTSWISGQPGVGALTDANDDPDGDGVANLLEYALGSEPGAADSAALPDVAPVGDHLALTFTPSVVTGLRYIIEASSDLSDWSDATDITALLTSGEPYTHTDSASLSIAPRRFLRLRIEMPEMNSVLPDRQLVPQAAADSLTANLFTFHPAVVPATACRVDPP